MNRRKFLQLAAIAPVGAAIALHLPQHTCQLRALINHPACGAPATTFKGGIWICDDCLKAMRAIVGGTRRSALLRSETDSTEITYSDWAPSVKYKVGDRVDIYLWGKRDTYTITAVKES